MRRIIGWVMDNILNFKILFASIAVLWVRHYHFGQKIVCHGTVRTRMTYGMLSESNSGTRILYNESFSVHKYILLKDYLNDQYNLQFEASQTYGTVGCCENVSNSNKCTTTFPLNLATSFFSKA